jgi:hypothetical protein
MIPNHQALIEAIHARKKVCVRHYSKADSGVLDRVCVPVDYGPGTENRDGLHRYWFWDCAATTESGLFGLLPPEIVNLQVLGDVFDPAAVTTAPWPWSVPRNWAVPAGKPESAPRPLNQVNS